MENPSSHLLVSTFLCTLIQQKIREALWEGGSLQAKPPYGRNQFSTATHLLLAQQGAAQSSTATWLKLATETNQRWSLKTMPTLSRLCTLTLTINYYTIGGRREGGSEGGAFICRQSKHAAAPLCFVFSRLRKIASHLIAAETCGEFS